MKLMTVVVVFFFSSFAPLHRKFWKALISAVYSAEDEEQEEGEEE